MRVIETKAYNFIELSSKAKEYAINKCRESESYLNYDWWDYTVYEDFYAILDILGCYDYNASFSGFYSQGDGASFTANWSYAKGCVKKIKEYAPKDKELHRIAEYIQDISQRNFYNVNAKIYHSGHYCHSNTMELDYYEREDGKEISENTDYLFLELSRDLADWLYKALEEQYDHLNTDECIAEHLEINEFEFEENGEQI
jgi:hypothetical protein